MNYANKLRLPKGNKQAAKASGEIFDFQSVRRTAEKRLKDEIIFPKTELTPAAMKKISARARENCRAYRKRVKEQLKASKTKARLIKGDYIEWIREQLQKAHSPGRVPKRSAMNLAPLLRHFDWRLAGIVPSVRNQKKCGACWAFAATAAFESSLMKNQHRYQIVDAGKTAPGPVPLMQIGISVQNVLDCVSKGDCAGGWHGRAFDHFVRLGVPAPTIDDKGKPIDDRDFIGKKRPCAKQAKNRLQAIAWDYVLAEPDKIPSIKMLKEMLLEYGPLAIMVKADDPFKTYPNGGNVEGDVFIGTNKFDVNHVVLLTGWDDDKRAWIIQNSFGANWGVSCIEKDLFDNPFSLDTLLELSQRKGCMYIRWKTNKVGKFAMWVEAPFELGKLITEQNQGVKKRLSSRSRTRSRS